MYTKPSSNQKQPWIKRILAFVPLQHLIFWGMAWYIMLKFFSNSSETDSIDYIYTSVFLIPVAAAVYVNILVFIPYLLAKKKYLVYLTLILISTGLAAWLNMFIFSDLIDYILPGYYFISYYEYTDLLKIFLAFIILTTLIELSKGWFRLSETRNKMILLEKEHAQVELSTLKSQINPHFLFNSLNSLYSLVITQSEAAPAYILELSGFLRYVLYETSSELVKLENELQSIRHYIEIQKLRTGQTSSITLTIAGEPSGKMIVPLLFLPLLENAFKHGVPHHELKPFIDISIIIDGKSISFSISNTISQTKSPEKEASGIGLTNLQKRLEHLYPDKYTFNIQPDNTFFKILLIVPLQNEAALPDN